MRILTIALLAACNRGQIEEEQIPTGPNADKHPDAPWPEWAFHHWVWEDESTQDSVMTLIDGYEEHDIPVGAIIIDSPWETGYNSFEWDEALFPDAQGMIDELHDRDIRVFLWITSVINVEEEELYDHAADNGWFMQSDAESGPSNIEWWKGEGALLDYGNPDAVDWWHGLMDKALDMGIDGWKTDGADFAALTTPYSPGLGRDMERLEYSHAYYQDFFDYTRQRLGDDRLITARPIDNYGADIGGDAVAFAPIDINWAAWVGDQDSDFEGQRMALRNMYHSSEYGYVAFGSDIGGYREDGSELGRDKEPFIRWAQMGALCPIMENGGGGAHEPWRFDSETVEIYRDAVAMHYALLPYLMEQGGVAFDAGTSLMTFTSSESYSYLLGPDIFVQPVLAEGSGGVASVEVSFPDGEWTWLYGDQPTYNGGSTETLSVALAEFPVFVRVDSEAADTLLAL